MAWGPDDVRKWSTLALLAIMGTALTAAVNPGFVATISQKGLDFACHEGVVVLQKELEAIKIPDFSGVFKVKALGKGYYDFYSMAVDGFHIPNPKISLLPTEGLQLSIKDANIKISGRWASRKNFLKAKGMFSLSIQGVSFSADLRLGKSSSGHITVNCSACESHIKSIHIQISGSMLGWLIQLFHKKIETTLRNIIYKKVTEVLPKAEVRLSRLLQLFCSMLGGRGELLEKWKDFLSNKLSQFSGQYVFPCEPRCGEAARNDFSSHKAKICRIVTNSVSSKLQPYVQTIPVIARVDDVARIDYSLMALTTTAAFLQGQLKGEFFWRGHRGPLPITSPAMSFPLNNDHMVHLSISEYFFNSAGFAYQESGTLKITLRDQMLPKDSKFRLNTEFLGTFLPKVAMKFPSTEVQLLVTTSLPPRLTIQPSGLSLNPALETQAFAVLLNSSLVPLFLLHMNTNASMEVDAEGDRLVGELKIEKLALELKHSDFGSFKVELLQAAIDYLMPKMVVPRINERLRKGFPLPLPAGIKLNSLMFQSYQNFLVLRADVNRT